MYAVMILGTGVMQQPAYRAAGRNGWYSIGVDRDPNGPAVRLADAFERVDLADAAGVLAVAERYRSRDGLDGVFTTGTDFSSTVAFVTERLGLPGIPYPAAVRATDKVRMRQCFRTAGVPSPQFRVIENGSEPQRLAERMLAELSPPLVVKPADNMGARGVQLVRRPEEACEAIRTAIGFSRSGRAVAEELIPGGEYSVDALVWKGEIRIAGVADRHIRFAPHFVEMGHTIPTELGPHELDQLIAVFQRGVRALGITHGAAKGDVFFGPRGAVIGEIAARLSGGYMSGWTYPLCSGVELTEAGMRLALGLDPRDLLQPRFLRVSAERAVISIPGRVRRVEGFETIRGRPGIAEVFQRVHPGESVRFPHNNVEKRGNVISVAETRQDAVDTAMDAVREVRIELEPGNRETAAFLFGDETPAAHRAFRLADRSNREAIAAMPPVVGPFSRLQPAARRAALRARPPDGAAAGKLSVVSLPNLEAETESDWRGLNLHETLAELRGERPIKIIPPGRASPGALAAVFWRAILTGGLQGAHYLIDTILECKQQTIEQEIFSQYAPPQP